MKPVFFFCIAMYSILNPSTIPLDLEHPELIEGKEFYVTYPKSGTTLLHTIIQLLTKKELKRINHLESNKSYNRLDLELDFDKPTLFHSHNIKSFHKKIDPSKNSLIMILRNFKECIPSYKKFSSEELLNSIVLDKGPFKQYIKNLIYFDTWANERTKLLIYYEDLISNPEETIKKIASFYHNQVEDDYLENLYDNYEDSWKKCYKSYKKSFPTGRSDGCSLIFHSKDFPSDLVYSMDKHIKITYPHLWEKYLSRYEYNPVDPENSL